MCGLVGFTGRRNSDALIAMTRHMAHRGPDAEGFLTVPTAPGLGVELNREALSR